MRLIDADALKSKVLQWMPNDPCGIEGKEFPLETDIVASLMMEIEDAPTIEPERKMGEWIIRDNPGTGWYRVTCSECGEDFTSVIQVIGFFPNAKVIWNYCPECGADMREKECLE